ncbi:MAG: PBP1A family penicillin-binding protein [Treponema sp.]|nr:PBP1A family penicillin-binding protein [Treponema sp.]
MSEKVKHKLNPKCKKALKTIFIVFFLLFIIGGTIGTGIGLGYGIAETHNIKNTEYFTEFDTALPTSLLDINGELITEFSSDEKRELISYQDLPQHLIDALITREDRIFFSHNGYSLKALFRAVIGQVLHMSLGGGSTLTQQIAGTMYCDRTEMSMKRKLKELWWAIQMERRYSKNEILEFYLNKIYFGGGTYGVNAASKYYFGHGATEITPAECALLVVQLSNPAFYNPFDHPNRAMDRQKYILASMVEADYITQKEAEDSFEEYWANFDYTRTSSSAYMMRDDKAPWFSEYVRRELGNMIYGSDDIFTSGFTVNTTLNLEHQAVADKTMQKWIADGNQRYQREHSKKSGVAVDTYIPLTELMSLLFDIPELKVSEQRAEIVAQAAFMNEVNPVLDIMSLLTGSESLKMNIVSKANAISKQDSAKTTIEGTMIALQSDTGYIDALVGGSKYDSENQFIRAIQAKLQPGSTFKPLYYSAAIDSRKFTPATEISDSPVVFHTADGKPYIPQNFLGVWEGNVQLWYALCTSMNVPSLKVLDGIGFEAAINRAVSLLGISDEELPTRGFVPGYPIGLGVCSVRPIEMARAYSIFANGGKDVTPIAIRTVEDKNGNVILNPELDLRKKQAAKGDRIQVISPQTSFVMTKLLEQTVQRGTLWRQKEKFWYKNSEGKTYVMPAAGKTGTTQNWADAWTCGFTPYYTAAFWFGFDKPGQSLGMNITGATLAGHAWGDYMSTIHKDMIVKDFPKPLSGVIECTVCSESGQILTEDCGNHQTTQWFLEGTQPTQVCPLHSNKTGSALGEYRLRKEMYRSGQHLTTELNTTPLTFSLDFLSDNYVFVEYINNDEESDEYDSESESFVEIQKPLNKVEDLDYNFLME